MRDATIVVILFFSLLIGSYRIGVWKERRDYLGVFIAQIESAYWEGFDDGRRLEKFKAQGGQK